MAGAGETRLEFDLERGSLQLESAAGQFHFVLASDSLRTAWEHYVRELSTQAWDPLAAARWGHLLFPADCAPLLQSVARWRIDSPELAGLDAVALPWSPSQPLLQSVELVFGSASLVAARGEGGLALQPFTFGAEPSHDFPDTLDAALSLVLRQLDHLPRNDVDAALVRALFVSGSYEILSLRADMQLPPAWQQQLEFAPPLRLWSWPSISQLPDGRAFAQHSLRLADGALLLADRWPLGEAQRAGDLRAVLAGMQSGLSASHALLQHKRELARQGEAPRRWAGWLAIGDADYRLRSKAPNALQAWLRAFRARKLGISRQAAARAEAPK